MLAENHGQFFLNFVVKTAQIWLVLGGFFCVFSNQKPFVICTRVTEELHSFLSQSELNNFFVYIIRVEIQKFDIINSIDRAEWPCHRFCSKISRPSETSISFNWALLHTGRRGVICDLNCSLHLIQIAQIACVCRRAWRIKPSYDPVSNLVEYYPMLGGTAGLKTPRSTPQEHSVMRKKRLCGSSNAPMVVGSISATPPVLPGGETLVISQTAAVNRAYFGPRKVFSLGSLSSRRHRSREKGWGRGAFHSLPLPF